MVCVPDYTENRLQMLEGAQAMELGTCCRDSQAIDVEDSLWDERR